MGDVTYYILMAAGLAVVLIAWRIDVLRDLRERQETEAFKRHLMIVVNRRDAL